MQAATCWGLNCSRLPYTRVGYRDFSSSSKRQHRAAAVTTQAAAGPSQAPLTLDTVLARVRQAVQGSRPLWQEPGCTNGMVFGEGVHMGLPVAWAFMWRPDGAWYEEIRSKHLTYKWGYDGAGQCWEVDPYGVSKVLEKDDHESSLLGALIRSGNWLVPCVADRLLEVTLEEPVGGSNGQAGSPAVNMPPVAATWEVEPCHSGTTAAAAAAAAAAMGHQQAGSGGAAGVVAAAAPAVQQEAPEAAAAAAVAEGKSRRRSKEAGASVYLTLRLQTGRMLARVQVSASTWRPVSYGQPYCSDTEAWLFDDWNNWTKGAAGATLTDHPDDPHAAHTVADVLYPRRVTHVVCRGVCNSYTAQGGLVRGPEVSPAYVLPVSPPVPVDVQYLETVSPRVPVWQTHQGHLLVQADLNGRKAGWMLLDTGASGFVIEPTVANSYGLPAFGDLSIAGVAGKVATRYRRASQLRLGPLVLSDPVMLEMSISKIVGAFHDRVIGIVGYDVFRRCRITIPCHNTRKAIQQATSYNGKINFCNSAAPLAAKDAAHPWPPTPQRWQQLAALTQLQQGLAAATAAAGSSSSSHSAAGAPAAAAAVQTAAAVRSRRRSRTGSSGGADVAPLLSRKRRRSRLSSSRAAAAAAAAGTAAATAVQEQQLAAPLAALPQQQQELAHAADAPQQLLSSSSSSSGCVEQQSHCDTQQQQQQQPRVLQLPPVPVPPPPYGSAHQPLPTALIEVLLHKPVLLGQDQLEPGYIWQDLVMIASLPHVELEFVVPGRPNTRHKSLFLVDLGAGGAEVMFHSRAARELHLLDHNDEEHRGWGEGFAEFRTVSGVGGAEPPATPQRTHSPQQQQPSPPPQLPPAVGPLGVGCQAGKLPELVIRGQLGPDPTTQGALQLRGVRALFNRAGGLDISLYSAGMVCADLLSRMQVVFDYPNKRIGWKMPTPKAQQQHKELELQQQLMQQQQQQQQQQ